MSRTEPKAERSSLRRYMSRENLRKFAFSRPALIGVIVTTFLLAIALVGPTSRNVSAGFDIKNAAGYELKFNIDPNYNITPTCGCMEPKTLEWAGVSFATNFIQINNLGPDKITFVVSSSYPGRINEVEHTSKFQISMLDQLVELPEDRSAALSVIANQIGGWNAPNYEDNFEMTNSSFDGKLFIVTQGHTPIHSFVPASVSTTNINIKTDQISGLEYVQIVDAIDGLPDPESDTKYWGWNVNLDGGTLEVTGPTAYLAIEQGKGTNRYSISRFEFPYALKISMRAITAENSPDGSAFDLQFRALDDQSYEELGRNIASNPIVDAKAMAVARIYGPQSTSLLEQDVPMRRPALPPQTGFNIYGEVSKLQAIGVNGSMMVDHDSIELVNAKLDFSGIGRFTDMGGVEYSSLGMDATDLGARGTFNGTGEVAINGSNAFTFFDYLSFLITVKDVLALLFAFAAGAAGYIISQRAQKE